MGRHQPDPSQFGIFVLCSAITDVVYVQVHVDQLANAIKPDGVFRGNEVLFELHFTDTAVNPYTAWWFGLVLAAWTDSIETSSDLPLQALYKFLLFVWIRVTSGAIEVPSETVFLNHLTGLARSYYIENRATSAQMFKMLQEAMTVPTTTNR